MPTTKKKRKTPRSPGRPMTKPPADDTLVRVALDRWVRKTLNLSNNTPTNDVRKSLATALILAANTRDPDLAKVYGLVAVSALKALSEIRCAEIESDADRVGQQILPRFAAPQEYDAVLEEVPEEGEDDEPDDI